MQTISVPYRLSPEDRDVLKNWRRVQSSAIRTAYAHAGPEGTTLTETELRDRLKARLANQGIDAWLLHCATREGMTLRQQVPDGSMIFGGKKNFERRARGLITAEQWKTYRLRPLVSIGDAQYHGNRHVRLALDGTTCTITVLKKTVTLTLAPLKGKWQTLLTGLAQVAANRDIAVTFRLDDEHLHVQFNEWDLRPLLPGQTLQEANDLLVAAGQKKKRGRPRGKNHQKKRNHAAVQAQKNAEMGILGPPRPRPVHPEWQAPVRTVAHRATALDQNPEWIGITVIEAHGDTTLLSNVKVLDYALVHLDTMDTASKEAVREMLAKATGLAVSMSRAWNVPVIALEKGLGGLRSSGPSRGTNRKNNRWPRKVLQDMLTRKATLAGMSVTTVPGAYSTTIGNVMFELPDACASAVEIARRALPGAMGERPSQPTSPTSEEPSVAAQPCERPTRTKGRAPRTGATKGREKGVSAGDPTASTKNATMQQEKSKPEGAEGALVDGTLVTTVETSNTTVVSSGATPATGKPVAGEKINEEGKLQHTNENDEGIHAKAEATRLWLRRVLPAWEPAALPNRWKDEVGQALGWVEAHRKIKTTKNLAEDRRGIGYRRPHHDAYGRDAQDRAKLTLAGHAVIKLGGKHSPGWIVKRVGTGGTVSTSFCT